MTTTGKVGIAVVAFAGAFVASQVVFSAARPKTPQEIQAQLERDVAGMRASLPQKVHPIVTWFDVEAGNQTIIYKYRVELPESSLQARRAELEKELKGSSLVWAAKLMLPDGVKVEIELFDEKEEYQFAVTLD